MSTTDIVADISASGSSGSDLTRLPSEGVVQQRAQKKTAFTDETFLDASPVERARLLLEQTRQVPRMFAYRREAMLMRVTTIMEMSGVFLGNEKSRELYAKYGEPKGCALTGMDKEVTNEWAHAVIDDALGML